MIAALPRSGGFLSRITINGSGRWSRAEIESAIGVNNNDTFQILLACYLFFGEYSAPGKSPVNHPSFITECCTYPKFARYGSSLLLIRGSLICRIIGRTSDHELIRYRQRGKGFGEPERISYWSISWRLGCSSQASCIERGPSDLDKSRSFNDAADLIPREFY